MAFHCGRRPLGRTTQTLVSILSFSLFFLFILTYTTLQTNRCIDLYAYFIHVYTPTRTNTWRSILLRKLTLEKPTVKLKLFLHDSDERKLF